MAKQQQTVGRHTPKQRFAKQRFLFRCDVDGSHTLKWKLLSTAPVAI